MESPFPRPPFHAFAWGCRATGRHLQFVYGTRDDYWTLANADPRRAFVYRGSGATLDAVRGRAAAAAGALEDEPGAAWTVDVVDARYCPLNRVGRPGGGAGPAAR